MDGGNPSCDGYGSGTKRRLYSNTTTCARESQRFDAVPPTQATATSDIVLCKRTPARPPRADAAAWHRSAKAAAIGAVRSSRNTATTTTPTQATPPPPTQTTTTTTTMTTTRKALAQGDRRRA